MPQPNTGQKSKEKFFTPGLDKFGLIEAQASAWVGFTPTAALTRRYPIAPIEKNTRSSGLEVL